MQFFAAKGQGCKLLFILPDLLAVGFIQEARTPGAPGLPWSERGIYGYHLCDHILIPQRKLGEPGQRPS